MNTIKRITIGPWAFEADPAGNLRIQRSSWMEAPVKQVYIPQDVILALAAELARDAQMRALEERPMSEILSLPSHLDRGLVVRVER